MSVRASQIHTVTCTNYPTTSTVHFYCLGTCTQHHIAAQIQKYTANCFLLNHLDDY